MNIALNRNKKKIVIITSLSVLLVAVFILCAPMRALAAPTVDGISVKVDQITIKSSVAVSTPQGQVYFPVQLKANKRISMYSAASSTSAILTYIPESTLMTGTGKSGNYYAATLPHGTTGYVLIADVSISAIYSGSASGTASMSDTGSVSSMTENYGEQMQRADAPGLKANVNKTRAAAIAESQGLPNPLPPVGFDIPAGLKADEGIEIEDQSELESRNVNTELGDRFTFTVNSSKPADVNAVSYSIYSGSASNPALEGRIKVTSRTGSTATAIGDIDTRSIKRGQYTIIFWSETERYTTQDNAATKPTESTPMPVYHTATITCGVDNPDSEYVSIDRAAGNIRCINADNTKLYSDKAMSNQATTLGYGEIVDLVSTSGDTAIILVNNRVYYLPSSALMTVAQYKQADPDKAYAAGAVEWALQQRGCTYILGGNGDGLQVAGRGVYDCSGLLWRAYRTGGGLNWGRTTAAGQLLHSSFTTRWVNSTGPEMDVNGFASAFSTLKPGDLVAFQTAAESDRSNNVTHIGLYVGNNRMVHAGDPVHVEYLGDFSLHVGGPKYGKIRGISRVK